MRFVGYWPWVASLLIALLLGGATFQPAEGSRIVAPGGPNKSSDAKLLPNDRLGIDHIGYGGQPATAQRYQAAADSGAGWTRWVAYWHDIERVKGYFDYDRYDATVDLDRAHGLNLNVVLMGTPGFYATTTPAQTKALNRDVTTAASAPANLDKPVFADGTDVIGPGKAVNPDNYWARYVSTTVNRYKSRVRYWEMWNEPDNTTFWWTGDGQEVKHYVRLLKVGYLAAKAADPDAKILLGGLMNWEWANKHGADFAWLRAFFAELAKDPARDSHGQYFDILPLHWYARAADLYDKTLSVRQLLASYGAAGKPIWINETNLPVCGDPQTGGKPDCTSGVAKGRLDEQAAFILQASANAFAAGVEKIFAFQLYDDSTGAFDYYGLLRNDHSRRPAFAAFQVAAGYFRDITSAVKVSVQPVEMVTMVTKDGGVVGVVWNNSPADVAVAIPARASRAMLVEQNGRSRSIDAEGGGYKLSLPGATFNLNPGAARADYPVGGLTYLIVEAPNTHQSTPIVTPSAMATPTGTATVIPAPTQTQQPSVKAIETPSTTPTPTPSSTTQLSPTPTPTPAGATPTMAATPIATTSTNDPAPATAQPDIASIAGPFEDGAGNKLQHDARLRVPASLSTVRVSDVREDGFSVSWVGSAPALGEVRCGKDAKPGHLEYDIRGADGRRVMHFVSLRGLQSDTGYLCEVQAGVELDDNGGAYFAVRTLPRPATSTVIRLRGTTIDEHGEPRPAMVYATTLEGSGVPRVHGALSDVDGAWVMDVPISDVGGRQAAVDGKGIVISGVSSAGLTVDPTLVSPDTANISLRLRFSWATYRSSLLQLQPGWNYIGLPLVPFDSITVDSMVRQVEAQGGKIGPVYLYTDDEWKNALIDGDRKLLRYGAQYAIWSETEAVWTMRGFDPELVGFSPPPLQQGSIMP